MPAEGGVLTHAMPGRCHAGYGTALGVIRAAVSRAKKSTSMPTKPVPFCRDRALPPGKLMKDGNPDHRDLDNMAGAMMKQGKIAAIVDRRGPPSRPTATVANKIGTYTVAVLAKENGIPFYVAAPISTVDLACPDGDHIPIELRNPKEVTHIAGADGSGRRVHRKSCFRRNSS